ncbi:MAG TPA: class I SAM-dependent methyltransferase [Roseiflexaceae bacterium]|nr:class I SAM-dependent methyltransferase [Roseiflexaceae bacterium]
MPIYHDYAPFYDGSGQIRFAVLIGQYLREVLARHPVHGRQALDLACGTGTLALILADDGWQVVGMDRSAAMLAIARERAADAGSQIAFVEGDMRALNAKCKMQNVAGLTDNSAFCILHSAFDLVTCTYDSLNYLLTEADLASCFAGVAAALRPGGLFFADMNTHHFLEHDWGVCDVLERPGFVQVAQSHFDSANACSTMVLTGFAGDDAHGYQRFDEVHVERAYAPESVASLLEAAGLHVEASYDCFTFQPARERSQRIAWVARKPGDRG